MPPDRLALNLRAHDCVSRALSSPSDSLSLEAVPVHSLWASCAPLVDGETTRCWGWQDRRKSTGNAQKLIKLMQRIMS